MCKRLSLLMAVFVISLFFGFAPVKYITEEPQRSLSVGEEVQIKVMAAGDWRNSGIVVKKGEKYRITAT